MPEHGVRVVLLVALFAPLLLVAYAARLAFPASLSVLDLTPAWQAACAVTAVLPVLILRRFGLLRPPRGGDADPVD